jgi:hypothetical protein
MEPDSHTFVDAASIAVGSCVGSALAGVALFFLVTHLS